MRASRQSKKGGISPALLINPPAGNNAFDYFSHRCLLIGPRAILLSSHVLLTGELFLNSYVLAFRRLR